MEIRKVGISDFKNFLSENENHKLPQPQLLAILSIQNIVYENFLNTCIEIVKLRNYRFTWSYWRIRKKTFLLKNQIFNRGFLEQFSNGFIDSDFLFQLRELLFE